MSANAAKYLLSIAGSNLVNFDVTHFSGIDTIGGPYSFDIEFRMADFSRSALPPDAGILDAACRLDIERNGETISYCGIVVQFYTYDSDDIRYKIRLAPHIYRLSLNSSNRIFQRLTVPEIIENVVKEAGLKEYFRFDLKPNNVKYPVHEFCVQYQETDLAFISRLMEDSGIWYYFEQVKQPNGTLKECAVVTDDFASFPLLGRSVPFMRGSGLAEIKTQTSRVTDFLGITNSGSNVVESINYISTKTALLPKSVRVRSYTHRYPEAIPEGFSDVRDGHLGGIYEYGGTINNLCEAEHRATLHARRLWVESSQIDGKGNCASFRAGLRVPITHDQNILAAGMFLLVSVKHEGGWNNGAYVYNNEFVCVSAESEIYASPLRTPIPRIDGVTTAPVGATNDIYPTLNEYGYYTVNMPSALDYGRNDTGQGGDYDRSKNIRLAQSSCGVSGEDKTPYGIHFPSKRGAEMVLAYVDGNPDRPIGLGFVPNAASPSVVRNTNHAENIIRSWGGNELVMDDTYQNQSIKLSTPEERYLELHDGNEFVRIKSSDSELLFNDAEKFTLIDVGGYKIHINYADDSGVISITTVKGNVIEMNDPQSSITIQNTGENGDKEVNKVVFNGDNKSITLDSMDNTVVLNGNDKRIAVESRDSKVVLDGAGKKIILESKDNKVVVDSGDNSVALNAPKNVNIKAGGKLVIDAKGGVSNKGATVNWDS